MINQYEIPKPEDNEDNKEKHIHITVNIGETVPLSIYERADRIAKISFNRIKAYEEELLIKNEVIVRLYEWLTLFVLAEDIDAELKKKAGREIWFSRRRRKQGVGWEWWLCWREK